MKLIRGRQVEPQLSQDLHFDPHLITLPPDPVPGAGLVEGEDGLLSQTEGRRQEGDIDPGVPCSKRRIHDHDIHHP